MNDNKNTSSPEGDNKTDVYEEAVITIDAIMQEYQLDIYNRHQRFLKDMTEVLIRALS